MNLMVNKGNEWKIRIVVEYKRTIFNRV